MVKNPHAGQDCCGPNACVQVQGVHHAPGGYLLPSGELVPEFKALPSDDNEFWVCRHPAAGITCFFVPPEGM